MAKFPSLTFTQKGMQMLVQAQNSHTLTFTCGKLGSGSLADSDDITAFTDLKAAKMTLPIVKADESNKEKIVLTFNTSNTDLEEGFVSRELGIFAKLDSGAETLYAYSNAGNNYDYIPSKDTPSDENRLEVSLVVSSSANINVQIDGSIVYMHKSDVEELISAHDTNADAHKALASTIVDTLVPSSDTDTIRNQLSELANRIKAATGAGGWKDDPSTTLASLATLVSNLASGSDVTWDGKKFTNTKLGISGLMDTNGYVSFGKNFGGLIIQWRTVGGSQTGAEKTETFPLAFRTPISLVCGNSDSQGTSVDNAYAYIKDNAHFVWATRGTNGNTGSYFKTTVWALGIS